MRNELKLGVFLLIVAGLAGLAIGYVYQITSPIIAEQIIQDKINSFSEVYPQVDEIKDESSQYVKEDSESMVSEVNVAYKKGAPCGVIYIVEPSGYNGMVRTLVAFDIPTQKVTGIKVLNQAETPGLGANATESWFADRFKDKTATQPLEVVKQEPVGDNQVLAITSATITSKAVTEGVNNARQHFLDNFVQQ